MNCCDPYGRCHPERWCCAKRNKPTDEAMATATKHTSTPADDEIENDLGAAALQLIVSYACIAVVSFALGLVVGQL